MKLNSRQLLIKNMVCDRCIFAIQQIFADLNLAVKVGLGEVETSVNLSSETIQEITRRLHKLGFEIIETRDNKLVEDIKKVVFQYLDSSLSPAKISLSRFITDQLPYDYSYLSDLFSTVEGITVERFFILKRIEKVKTLIKFGQLNLTEIAYQTGFSSVHHLSSQFKKVTYMTPSHFKQMNKISSE